MRNITKVAVLVTLLIVTAVALIRALPPKSEAGADPERIQAVFADAGGRDDGAGAGTSSAGSGSASVKESGSGSRKLEKATFGGGCFWCMEAVFQKLKGIESVVSGFSGGKGKNPTYLDVGTGTTGYAEVIQVTYDPKVISYPELLEVFWSTHDPTTKDRQGSDVGTQYRSVIFYHNDEQKKLAEKYKEKLDKSGAFKAPIVTQVVAFTAFCKADAHHQNYFLNHADQPYCTAVIRPKVEKFEKVFKDKLKKGS